MSDASASANECQTGGTLVPVRCPKCNRLACEAAAGSLLRIKCGRCGRLYERTV